jgi:hypothetical protein
MFVGLSECHQARSKGQIERHRHHVVNQQNVKVGERFDFKQPGSERMVRLDEFSFVPIGFQQDVKVAEDAFDPADDGRIGVMEETDSHSTMGDRIGICPLIFCDDVLAPRRIARRFPTGS